MLKKVWLASAILAAAPAGAATFEIKGSNLTDCVRVRDGTHCGMTHRERTMAPLDGYFTINETITGGLAGRDVLFFGGSIEGVESLPFQALDLQVPILNARWGGPGDDDSSLFLHMVFNARDGVALWELGLSYFDPKTFACCVSFFGRSSGRLTYEPRLGKRDLTGSAGTLTQVESPPTVPPPAPVPIPDPLLLLPFSLLALLVPAGLRRSFAGSSFLRNSGLQSPSI